MRLQACGGQCLRQIQHVISPNDSSLSESTLSSAAKPKRTGSISSMKFLHIIGTNQGFLLKLTLSVVMMLSQVPTVTSHSVLLPAPWFCEFHRKTLNAVLVIASSDLRWCDHCAP